MKEALRARWAQLPRASASSQGLPSASCVPAADARAVTALSGSCPDPVLQMGKPRPAEPALAHGSPSTQAAELDGLEPASATGAQQERAPRCLQFVWSSPKAGSRGLQGSGRRSGSAAGWLSDPGQATAPLWAPRLHLNQLGSEVPSSSAEESVSGALPEGRLGLHILGRRAVGSPEDQG